VAGKWNGKYKGLKEKNYDKKG